MSLYDKYFTSTTGTSTAEYINYKPYITTAGNTANNKYNENKEYFNKITLPINGVVDLDKLMHKNYNLPPSPWPNIKITKVLFNGPATIIFFSDGTKSSVKITSDPEFNGYDDRESAMMFAFLKRVKGSRWKKELKGYRYALECTLPSSVIDEYSMELDNAYLRTMIDRFDKKHGSNFREQISKIEYVRFLDWPIFEGTGKLFVYRGEFEDLFNRRKKNG